MSKPPFVHGRVRVTWQSDRVIDAVTFDNHPLIEALGIALQEVRLTNQGVVLSRESSQLLESLLASIASINNGCDKVLLADKIFSFVLNTTLPNPKLKVLVLEAILREVWRWEDTHEMVHKGSIYYFIAQAYLEQGDIPSAYIYFFNALEEDKRNFPILQKDVKEGGAYLTISLVDNPQMRPYLYNSVVVPLRRYLQQFIDGYNSSANRNMTLQELDRKFLQAEQMEDVKRFFVATFHEIYHLSSLSASRMINNDYSKLKIMDTLLNISLVVDCLLEHRFLRSRPKKEKKMANALYKLALRLRWTKRQTDSNVNVFLKQIRPDLNRSRPDRIVPSLLNGVAKFHGRNLNNRQIALFLAYHIRNFASHNIEGQSIWVLRYPQILENVMNAFFTAIEVL